MVQSVALTVVPLPMCVSRTSSPGSVLAYMRTNRLTANACGRDWRIWIVGALYRAMHGYKERRIFRRSRFGVPTERAAVIE